MSESGRNKACTNLALFADPEPEAPKPLPKKHKVPKRVRFLQGEEEYKYASFLRLFEWQRRGGRAARFMWCGGPEGKWEELAVKWWEMKVKARAEGWLEGVEEGVGEEWWERDEKGRAASLGTLVVEGNWGARHEEVRGKRKWSGGKW